MNRRHRRVAQWRDVLSFKAQRELAERIRRKLGIAELCACGKIIHRNRCDAKDHIAELLARDETGDALSLQVYRCRACHYWHVGHAVRPGALTPA